MLIAANVAMLLEIFIHFGFSVRRGFDLETPSGELLGTQRQSLEVVAAGDHRDLLLFGRRGSEFCSVASSGSSGGVCVHSFCTRQP